MENPKEYQVKVARKIYNPFTNEVVHNSSFEHSFEEETYEGFWQDNGVKYIYIEGINTLDYNNLTDIGLECGLAYKYFDAELDSDEIVVLSEDKKTITVKLPFSEVGAGEINGTDEWDRLGKIDDEIFNEDVWYGLLAEYTYKFNQEVEDFYGWTQYEEEGNEEYPYG